VAAWPYNTQRWQRLRRMKLQVNPLCETCLRQQPPRIEPATTVDHLVAVKAPGGEAYPPLSRLRSQCTSCHNRKTRIVEQLGEGLDDLTIKGCDVYGYPLDPAHSWYSYSPLRERERH
jgi:5-methylcytosine-specific restriction enzyme A